MKRTAAGLFIGVVFLVVLSARCSSAPSCDASTCSGCCAAAGVCEPSPGDAACGLPGAQCVDCTASGKTCVSGAFVGGAGGGSAGGGAAGGSAGAGGGVG